MRIASRLEEEGGRSRDLRVTVTENPDGGGADFVLWRLQANGRQVLVGLSESPANPKGFKKVSAILGILGIQLGGPGFHGG